MSSRVHARSRKGTGAAAPRTFNATTGLTGATEAELARRAEITARAMASAERRASRAAWPGRAQPSPAPPLALPPRAPAAKAPAVPAPAPEREGATPAGEAEREGTKEPEGYASNRVSAPRRSLRLAIPALARPARSRREPESRPPRVFKLPPESKDGSGPPSPTRAAGSDRSAQRSVSSKMRAPEPPEGEAKSQETAGAGAREAAQETEVRPASAGRLPRVLWAKLVTSVHEPESAHPPSRAAALQSPTAKSTPADPAADQAESAKGVDVGPATSVPVPPRTDAVGRVAPSPTATKPAGSVPTAPRAPKAGSRWRRRSPTTSGEANRRPTDRARPSSTSASGIVGRRLGVPRPGGKKPPATTKAGTSTPGSQKAAAKKKRAKQRTPATPEARRRRIPVALAAVFAVAVLATSFPLSALLSQHHQLSAAGAQLAQLQQQNRALAQQKQALDSNVAITQLARGDYQLVYPGQTLYDVLPPSNKTGTTTPGSPTSGDPGNQPLVAPANAPDLSPQPGQAQPIPTSTAGAVAAAVARDRASASSGRAPEQTAPSTFWGRVADTLEFWK